MQKRLSSSLLSNNIKIKIYRIIMLPVILCGYKNWSLTLREERRLRLFENRVLRPKRDEVKSNGENYIIRNSMICSPHQILTGCSNREE